MKNRVHLDVYARSVAELEALGAERAAGYEETHFTVMLDPEENEFCAFVREDVPLERCHGLVVDSNDPAADARWLAELYGARVTDDAAGFSTVSEVPGMPILTMDFDVVPEEKAVKNRLHWDVTADELGPLLEAGAVLLRSPDDDVGWHVLADPAGNEFCVFSPPT